MHCLQVVDLMYRTVAKRQLGDSCVQQFINHLSHDERQVVQSLLCILNDQGTTDENNQTRMAALDHNSYGVDRCTVDSAASGY